MLCYSFDVFDAHFVWFSASHVGNLMNYPRRPTICIAFSLTHPPAVLLDIERESPMKWCMAPEANNHRHKRSCKTGGRGQCLCVDRDMSGRKPRRYKIVWWRKRYFSNISSLMSSSVFWPILKDMWRRSCRIWSIRCTASLLWAAIFSSPELKA